MNKSKEILITGIALFSMIFGAGNLILPPFLGFQGGAMWWLVALGFLVTAVLFPIMGFYAHAHLQGTMYDFAKRVSHRFSLVFCALIYIIAITLPTPRTAAVTHEMALEPFFDIPAVLTSAIYFGLVFVFVMNRSAIIHILGKYLTPLIGFILIGMIGVGLFFNPESIRPVSLSMPFVDGILEGYQTFDAMASLLSGGVVVISAKMLYPDSKKMRKELVLKSGLLAGLGLLVFYCGLIYLGSSYSASFDTDTTRVELLAGLSFETLGVYGQLCLSVLVGLACFTTAVGIVIGTADYFSGLYGDSKKVYLLTAALSCIIGIGIGQLDVHYILAVALPVLMGIYPIILVLIVINCFPDRYFSDMLFKSLCYTALLFSIPDVIKQSVGETAIDSYWAMVPFSEYGFAWVPPVITVWIAFKAYERFVKKSPV